MVACVLRSHWYILWKNEMRSGQQDWDGGVLIVEGA
jgi:hypothetical protein